jgi:hypothetical protein
VGIFGSFIGNTFNVIGRGATTTAYNVYQPGFDKIINLVGGFVRGFVVRAKLVGQACVWIGRYKYILLFQKVRQGEGAFP